MTRSAVGAPCALFLLLGSSVAFAQADGASGAFTDGDTTVEVDGYAHVRYESVDRRLRAGESGSNQGIFTRLLLQMRVRHRSFQAFAEVIDARLFGEPDDARPTTGQVDTVELLQGYVGGSFREVFAPDDSLEVLLGRQTMDVGSRRLLARNRYRNTINAFTGLNAMWDSGDGNKVQAFYTFPVQRLPGNGDRQALVDGDIAFDEERRQLRFYGVYATLPTGWYGSKLEPYFMGLKEADGGGFSTRDRNLKTFGARWVRRPSRAHWHFEFESAFQHGRASTSTSATSSLDQRAYLHHATVGYTFDGEDKARVEALFDIASGDRDPSDGRFERFDSLFGVPRGEFGPTGIFREIARANVVSPGLRYVSNLGPGWDIMALQRWNYLASDRDAWTTTGIVDPTGNSGSYIGSLSEVRLRWDVVPDSVQLEFGVAYHAAGSFAEEASTGDGGRDSLFGYFQTSFWF